MMECPATHSAGKTLTRDPLLSCAVTMRRKEGGGGRGGADRGIAREGGGRDGYVRGGSVVGSG